MYKEKIKVALDSKLSYIGADSERIINALVDNIKVIFKKEKERRDKVNGHQKNVLEIRNFGNFKIKKKEERIARNPRDNRKVLVKSGWKVIFKPSKKLIERINLWGPRENRRERR